MFRLLLLHTMGLASNTPSQERYVDQDDLLVYTLKGSPRKYVREFLQHQLGRGDVWVINEQDAFAVIELTFSGYRITGTHNGLRFTSEKVEALIAGLNNHCNTAA